MWKTRFFPILMVAVLLVAASPTSADTDRVARLIGVGECADCGSNDLKGIQVAVVCKSGKEEEYMQVAVGEFGGDGKFSLQLPSSLLKGEGDELNKQCFAQVHSSSKNNPCPTLKHQDNFMLSLSSNDKSVPIFGTAAGKLSFSRAVCSEKTFWTHPWFHNSPFCPPPPYKKPEYNPPPYTPRVHNPPPYKKPEKNPPPYKPRVHNPPPCKKPEYNPPPYKPRVHNPPPCKKPEYNPPPYKPRVHNPPPYKTPEHNPPPYKTPVYDKPPCFKPIHMPPMYIPKVPSPPSKFLHP